MKRGRPLTAEERDLWARVTQRFDPLPGRSRPDPTPRPVRQQSAPKPARPLGTTPSPAPLVQSKRPADPFAQGIDGITRRRVRRGRQGVDGTLDLHGMRQSDAHHALSRFVLNSSVKGRRCVLIITGKGRRDASHPDDAAFMAGPGSSDGILRRQVPLWLRQEPLRGKIYAVEEAHQTHGGSGAFYVFLKRADKQR